MFNAFSQGIKAHQAGCPLTANPYPLNPRLAWAWRAGWETEARFRLRNPR